LLRAAVLICLGKKEPGFRRIAALQKSLTDGSLMFAERLILSFDQLFSGAAGLARSQKAKVSKRQRGRYLAYGIPLLALALVAGVYVANYLPYATSPAAMDFTFQIVIEVSNGTAVRAVAPNNAIGEPGGYWQTSQYNSYGIDAGHYPIYLDFPSSSNCPGFCTVHVKSRAVHSYTLQDYFNVWGQPLGRNDTIGLMHHDNVYWELCVGIPPDSYNPPEWGGLVLQPAMNITLLFHDYNNPGCTLS